MDDDLLGPERVGRDHWKPGRERLSGEERVGLPHDRGEDQHVVTSERLAEHIGVVRRGGLDRQPVEDHAALLEVLVDAMGGEGPGAVDRQRGERLEQDVDALHPVGPAGVEEAEGAVGGLERPGGTRRQALEHVVGHAVLVDEQGHLAQTVGGQDPDGHRRGGQHDVGAPEQRPQAALAVLAPRHVDLAGAAAGLGDERAGPVVAVDQELPAAEPPEVVHRHDDPAAGRLRGRQEARTQRLEGVEVHDVGPDDLEVGPEPRRDLGVQPVALVGPSDPGRGHDPMDREPGVVDLVPLLERRTLTQPAGEDRDVVAPAAETLRHPLGLERATTHKVRRIVRGDREDTHICRTLPPAVHAPGGRSTPCLC